MAENALPVQHLFTVTAQTTPPMMVQNGPQGTRMVVGVTGGTFEGPRLKGTVAPNAGGDYVTVRADGTIKLDVRLVLTTEDGATILMTYNGIGKPREGGGYDLRTAPLFETGDARYTWLNSVQAVATGAPGRGNVTYTVYELL
jgi:hypothetical protein